MNQIYQTEPADSSIDIKEYLHLFWSWAWLIILAGALAGGVTYFMTSRQIPIYQTSVRLLVSNPSTTTNITNTTMLNSTTMANTYSEMVGDAPVLQGVIDRLKLPMTTDMLKGRVSVNLVNSTQILIINITDTDPQRAADIANTLAEVFIDRVRELYAQRFVASKEGISLQVAEMAKKIDETNVALTKVKNDSEKMQLENRLTEYTRMYSDMVLSYEEIRLSEAQASANVMVTEPAIASRYPISPNPFRDTMLAIAVGALMAAAVIFAVDVLDDTIKNPEEIRRRYNIPVLGVIAKHDIIEGQPISEAEPRSPIAESFRALRTNILYAAVDTPLKKILITSPTPKDGKTTISSNLAVVLSQNERKTVLIDADLRRPQIHHRFGLLNRFGLSDLFVQPTLKIGDALQATRSQRLAIIPSGSLPPNPAELLTSQRMNSILDVLEKAFDTVIIDTPPVLSVTDAVALGKNVDGVILVAKVGTTKKNALKQSIEMLQAVQANILGVVINELEPRSRKYGYYYSHYSSSRYYYADGEKGSKGKKARPAEKAVTG